MIAKYTLKNGIPVFIVETHASPVVSIQAWVNRGSVYESEKEAGISHFLEHALFKGTKKRGVGQIASEIESRGGDINAFTSFEETCYYTTIASRYFAEGVDIIADAVQNPLFDAEEMAREKEVILEEIKRAYDSPYKVLSMNLWKESFAGTPYSRPVLGYESTVKNINHKSLKAYFDKHYHAGTLSLFIVGDIAKEKAFELVKSQFSKLKAQKPRNIPNLVPKPFRSPKVVAVGKDVQESHLQLAWLAPSVTDLRVPAFDVMCTSIGQGESSRLYQHLVKNKKIALDCSMGLVATAKGGLATTGLSVIPENLESALIETLDFLEKTASEGIEDSELERVKSSLEAEVVSGKETVEGYARRLGYYFIQFGDPDYERKYLEAVLAVDKDQATQTLNQILNSKPILSMIHPKDQSVETKTLRSILDRKRKKIGSRVSEQVKLELKKKNSIRFVEKIVTSLPIVSMKIIFPGGSREENKDNLGVGQLFQRLWASGTPSFSSVQIAHTLESLGASIDAFSGKHTLGLSVEFLSKHWPIVKPLLTDILLNPTFPKHEFETEKNILLREIKAERDFPGAVCQLNLMKSIYGSHPYGRSSLGTEQSISKLTPKDLKDYYLRFVHKQNAIISTVGAFQKNVWESEIQNILEKLPENGHAPQTKLTIESKNKLQIVTEKKTPLFQSHLLIGFLTNDIHDPDRYAMKILSSCLAGQGGRLFLELRDKQSLAYTVSPMNSDTPEKGFFGFYIGCSPEKLFTAIQGMRRELDKVLNETISSKELERAKQFWIGRFELDLQRFSSQAIVYGLDEMYGLGYDHALKVSEKIRSVTREQIQKAAQRFLKPEHATLSVVHPEELDKSIVERAWISPNSQIQPSSKTLPAVAMPLEK